jgi:hypothetical protein
LSAEATRSDALVLLCSTKQTLTRDGGFLRSGEKRLADQMSQSTNVLAAQDRFATLIPNAIRFSQRMLKDKKTACEETS